MAPPSSPAAAAAKFVFHSASAAVMATSYFSIASVMGKITLNEYGGDLQYLTVIGFITAATAMVLSAANDIMPTPLNHALKRITALAAMPVEITISAIYWPLIIFSPHLMLPPNPKLEGAVDPLVDPKAALVFLPLWMDLGLHAVPALSLVIDFFILERKYRPPFSTYGAALIASGFSAAYVTWVEHCAAINGKFPYPFLTMMPFESRMWVYAGATLFALMVFWALNAMHRRD